MKEIKEFHLFAGIGGGIYGGHILGHKCCGAVEIDSFCQKVLKQRQSDKWLPPFDIYGDIFELNGADFKGKFDILCGGFPCQAFSTAAHGKNIPEKNIWGEMLRFAQESDAPIIFGENVVYKAISKAKEDLEKIGYRVECCKLSCAELGGDHQRNRFWLLAVKNEKLFQQMYNSLSKLPKIKSTVWISSPHEIQRENGSDRRKELKAIGNAQSPFAASAAFRILANRLHHQNTYSTIVNSSEIDAVFEKNKTWIKSFYGEDFGLVHTPTTMANYSAPSMMKHQGCRNFVKVFNKPAPLNAEYLMGFPIGASSANEQDRNNFIKWYE